MKGNEKFSISLTLLEEASNNRRAKIQRLIQTDPLTMVRSLQSQAGLMMGKDLQLDLVCGVGQELGGFRQRAVLHAGSVDGQDVVPHVQCAASAEGRQAQCSSSCNMTFMSFVVKSSVSICSQKGKLECYRRHHL